MSSVRPSRPARSRSDNCIPAYGRTVAPLLRAYPQLISPNVCHKIWSSPLSSNSSVDAAFASTGTQRSFDHTEYSSHVELHVTPSPKNPGWHTHVPSTQSACEAQCWHSSGTADGAAASLVCPASLSGSVSIALWSSKTTSPCDDGCSSTLCWVAGSTDTCRSWQSNPLPWKSTAHWHE